MAGHAAQATDVYAQRLADGNIDAKLKLQIASELRDSIDLFTHTEYSIFLSKLMPVFLDILRGQPVFVSTSPEQKLRNLILDTIHRLPFNPPEALKPYATDVMKLLMDLVRTENEENAVLCMKTIMDFQRNYNRDLEEQVQPFLNLILEMFGKMPQAVKDTFDNPSTTSGATPTVPGTPGNPQNFNSPKPMSPMIGQDPTSDAQQPAKMLVKGMHSFKVLAECPIIVVSLFQAHRNSVHKNVKLFVPLIKTMLQLQAGPQKQAHEQAAEKGVNFTGVSPNIRNRAAFGEFVTAQVKTMSFLAYVLRVYAQQLQDFLPQLPDIVVRLLKDCPRERSGARKELLVATRHIINFNFRRIFLKKIDELLDERVLIGDGLTVYETMRPLAYSMLADLIHHVREQLNPDQIRRTVDVYTKNLHDDFPGTSFQTMSAKLLLNLAEFIAKLDNKKEARHYLVMILDAIAEKFAAMNRQYPNAVKQHLLYKKSREEDKSEDEYIDQSKEDYDEIDIFAATPIKTTNPRERGSDPIADNKFLFKNLMNGLKSMMYALRSCNPATPPPGDNLPANWNEVAFGFSAEEVNVITNLFREGARVFRYYSDIDSDTEQPTAEMQNTLTVSNGKEEKDLLEVFATVFHCIDPATFHEVFHSEIPHLYEMMFEHSALIHVPQFFLASEATSPSFCGMLLQFLMKHIEEVGTSESKRGQVLLRLFKLSFMAVTLFSAQNETVLLPHVKEIVLKSVTLATTAEEPLNYFLLLRNLFRSIGGGRFEHLYKEILPLLEVLLENLNTQLNSARKTNERDLYVELCLTVPARLSNLLPHLSFLMRPLVVALKGSNDLVSKGLKTLELCVDNLTADYLDPIMAPYIDDLMAALWEHLRPLPYNHFHSHTTMRILGKLGGRNRKFLNHPPDVLYKPFSDDICSVNVRLIGTPGERPFPILQMVDLSLAKIIESRPLKTDQEKATDLYYKKQSLKYLSNSLKLFIGFDQLPEDFVQMVRLYAADLVEGVTDSSAIVLQPSDKSKSVFKKHDQEAVLRKLIQGVIFATAVEQLRDDASTLIYDVCRHFTILELGRAVMEMRQRANRFVVDSGEGLMHLDSRVLADAIGDCLSSDVGVIRETTQKAMRVIYDSAATLLGSKDNVQRLPFFLHLAKIFCHNCYEEEWYPKSGGVLGIRTLAEDVEMGDEWMKERQNDFIRALLYVVKDMPPELPASTRLAAQETLELVLRKVNQNSTLADFEEYHSKTFNLAALLICEVSNPNKHVRDTAQRAFSTLEEIVGVPKHQLMLPVKDRLLMPIFGKPLRALPFASQIGYIDAITYCLKLQPSFLEFGEDMTRLMMEALALADADDEQLSNKSMVQEYRTSESILNLRVVCIKLLSTIILCPEFNAPEKTQARSRIISVFFKSLYYKSPEVIDAANAGLKGVLQQTNKLPRDLLQSGLRPILMNLSDPKRLNVQGLEGLARLLELLTNYFKVEIGSRLLDHLKTLADINVLQKTSIKLLEQDPNIRIITAILNIYHLLPPAAVSFMSGLFDTVIDLEDKLRRTQHSPVRVPLLKFINRYPKETWLYIQSSKLPDIRYGRIFSQLLKDESSKPLRDMVQENIPEFLAASVDLKAEGTPKYTAIVSAINIVNSISVYATSEWMVNNRELMLRLLQACVDIREKSKASQIIIDIKLGIEQASATAMDIFMTYLTHTPDDLDFLFQVIDATTSDKRGRTTNILTHHIYSEIICKGSIDQWRNIIYKCLDLYTIKSSTQETKTFAFHYLVNPILAMDKKRGSPIIGGQKLVDKNMIDMIHNKIWRPNLGDLGDDASHGLDHSRMELLQMSALLIRDHHASLADSRKNVIKFGWNYIKLEDIVNKQAAYVLIAFFIRHYETPSKIVIQIYVALLKAYQQEGRPLVTQALELIAPVLKQRVPTMADTKYPIWARWPRRILSEEGHNQHQMTNIFQFLVRHDDLFYESREHFCTWIVTAMPKLVFQMQTPSTEHKKLFIKLVTLIWKWEEHRVELSRQNSPVSSPSRKRKHALMDATSQSPSASGAQNLSSNSDALTPSLRTLVIRHLVGFICRLPDKYTGAPDDMCAKALRLLKDFLSPNYWADLEIDLYPKVMDEYLVKNDIDDKNEKYLPGFINALHVLRVILDLKTDDWIMQQVPYLQKVLEKPLRSENAEVQESLQPLLARVLQALPVERIEGEDEEMEDSADTPATQFLALLTNVVQENLNTNLMSSVHILWTLSQKRPSVIDDHIQALMKAFQKLGKDHLSLPPAQSGAPPIPAPKPDPANGQMFDPTTTTDLLCKVIDVAASRVGILGDQRRPFLSVMAQLVEKSLSTELCNKILGIVENWVFESTETFPTLKEKTAVLSKMLSFESRPDPELCNNFLDLVIKIYEHPEICKTELTVRLEHAFLVGTRARDVTMRNRFLRIFDHSISRTLNSRFQFVLASQNWETLNESYWLHQATHMLLGSIDMDCRIELHQDDLKVTPVSKMFTTYADQDKHKADLMVDDRLEEFVNKHRRFCQSLSEVRASDMLEPLRQLQHLDPHMGHEVWKYLFPLCWSALGREDRFEMSRCLVSLLSKDWHAKQMEKRPNVIASLLEGIERARPKLTLPTHLIKYLSFNYDAWYTSLHLVEDAVNEPPIDSAVVREANLDALAEMYAKIGEEDMFYGLWRRRAQYIETNAAISFEQNGMWDKAQLMYENAQIKARTGVLPFSNAEYVLWEDHWVLCAQKLQQWEILGEFAKHENYNDLMLECGWRAIETWNGPDSERMDQTVKSLMDSPTPRRFFFAAFMALQKVHLKQEVAGEFTRLCDEAIQLSLRKWHSFPKKITNAHIPLLQAFQQLVELHDASIIYASLGGTNAQNLDTKSAELKMLLGTWRDRLPNVWDDINSWHDLVTWRQHIFRSINNTYLPLLPTPNPASGGSTNNSYAYRGYHETAWIINRFAHVARKHNLPDVCINQLSKIYTLPNIEIQEAFLKLREQAKCHYQNSNELQQGLEVINNTNLGYFAAQQKAEFYTLKGMFLSKLKNKEDANEAFSLALYHDLKLPKAWAQWGHYNDQLFKENPTDMGPAGNAVSCYLEAAGLYKNGKARKLLSRVLWLLSLDDASQSIHNAFDAYKGEVPVWYWITYIPQLLTSLSHKEARLARAILIKIAKNYPQALYFLLRTSKEDYQVIKKQTAAAAARGGKASSPVVAQAQPPQTNGTSDGKSDNAQPQAAGSPTVPNASSPGPPGATGTPQPQVKRLPWEYAEEIMSVLKTAFPLLALSMETMGDQIQKFFKCPPDEDAYRLIVALLNDGLQWISRANPSLEEAKLPPTTEANITRFAETILPAHIRVAFEADFVTEKPTLFVYIERLRRWRDRFEEKLDRRPAYANLESYSPHLSEFRFQKFDDVEIPGQYLQHKDNNKDFIRIERFLPKVDVVRGYGICHRRLKMRGHDGSVHAFAIQHPAARHCRREERILQLFRIFNGVLERRKESRRRNLGFHLPLMVPLAPHIRLVQDDASYISLQGIYEDHCRQIGLSKDEPVVFSLKKVIASLDPNRTGQQAVDPNVKLEIFKSIQSKMVPQDIVLKYMQQTYTSYSDFFLFRRQFSYQFAALTFMTYVMNLSNRFPHKMFIARSSGNIWGSELIPAMASTNPYFHNNEPVPFRLTPNIQTLMGTIAIEGIFSCAVMAIARCLTEPEFDLEQHLSVFVRDEMIFWFTQQHRSSLGEAQLREKVQQNSDIIVKRASALGQSSQGNLPANQTVIDNISKAVNPYNLAQLDNLWMPYL